MSVIAFLSFELVKDFDERSLWITTNDVFNPGQLLFRVRFRCGVKGRCELSRKDSLLPSNRLFQRIREALDTLYRRQKKSTEAPFR